MAFDDDKNDSSMGDGIVGVDFSRSSYFSLSTLVHQYRISFPWWYYDGHGFIRNANVKT